MPKGPYVRSLLISDAVVHMHEVYIFVIVIGSAPVLVTVYAWLTLPAAMEMVPKS